LWFYEGNSRALALFPSLSNSLENKASRTSANAYTW
jgi:hypothetical protein